MQRLYYVQKWKMTSNLSKMKDELNFYLNGRRPKKFQKWKMTSNFSKMEEGLIFSEMEDLLNILKKGR